MRFLPMFSIVLALPYLAQAQTYTPKPNAWSAIETPLPAAPQPVGVYSNGCQIGAQILPPHQAGYYDIRRTRHRYFTQPQTIQLIKTIGAYVHQQTGLNMLIGDSSQPIGGPMSYAHASHQNGLDVDIYFAAIPDQETPPKDYPVQMVVDKAAGTMNLNLWQPAYRDALYAAATYPQTARIFVNPIIKGYLCATEKNTAWLRKVRPWWGHDEHFHVRLNCPAGAAHCQSQAPVPAGDGCTADVQHWIKDQSNAILHPKPAQPHAEKPLPIPPLLCQEILIKAQQAQAGNH